MRSSRSPRPPIPSPAPTQPPARPLCPALPDHPKPAALRPQPGHVRMEIRQHEWLSASPHEGFEQMRLKSRPKDPSPSLTRVGANFYSSVKQQDYSASVWLRRKDKLEHVRAPRSLGPRPAPASRTPTYPGGGRSARGARGPRPVARLGGRASSPALSCHNHRAVGREGELPFPGLPGRRPPRPPRSLPRCRGRLHCALGCGVTRSGAATGVVGGTRRCAVVRFRGRFVRIFGGYLTPTTN